MKRRAGFTLIELLVVVAILIALTTFVVTIFNATSGGDRVRSAARTAQSAFLGAKDRALHAKAKRGIRLVRDQGDGSLVNGFIYLQPIDNQLYPQDSFQLERRDDPPDGFPDSGDVVIVRGFSGAPAAPPFVDWFYLQDFFASPPRMRIPAGTGQWYTFFWANAGTYAFTATTPVLQLTTPLPDAGIPGALISHPRFTGNAYTSCEIEMAPEMLPNHAPIPMPSGVVIDLLWSQIPGSWYSQRSIPAAAPLNPGEISEGPDPTAPGNIIARLYANNLDMMYSPRGMITGPISALGPIHLLLNDIQDATQNLNPIDPVNRGDKLVLTVFPQTGHVQTYPIDTTDNFVNATGAAGADGFADDLFRYARTGSRTGN